MTTPTLLRLALFGALGLSTGCAPATATIDRPDDTPAPNPCGDHPLLTRDDAQAQLAGTFEVCAPSDPGQACAPADELEVWSFLSEALGPHPEPDFCGWYGEDVCGPTPSGDNECCYVMVVSSICEGRPLLAAEGAVVASVTDSPWAPGGSFTDLHDLTAEQRAAGATLWTSTALAEHASIGSFARATLELLGLGAPAHLVDATSRAQGDEIRHAAQAFAIASALAGRPIGPGPVSMRDIHPRTQVADVLVGVIVEGCVNETLAAAEATEAARLCTTEILAAALHDVAHDEARHAALAWKTLRWLLGAHPSLRPVADRALSEALEFRGPAVGHGVSASVARAIGALTGRERDALSASVVRIVLRPLAASVLGVPERTCRSC